MYSDPTGVGVAGEGGEAETITLTEMTDSPEVKRSGDQDKTAPTTTR